MRPCDGAGECAYFHQLPPIHFTVLQRRLCLLDLGPQPKSWTNLQSRCWLYRRRIIGRPSKKNLLEQGIKVHGSHSCRTSVAAGTRLGMARRNKWFSEKRQGNGWEGGRLGRSSHRRGFVVRLPVRRVAEGTGAGVILSFT